MAAKGTTEMEVGGDGVAVITICNPPVNSLSIDVLLSLKKSYEEALQRKDVKAIVVTGKGGKFSGGFDISSFGDLHSGKIEQPKVGYISIDILTELLEGATKPSVAAIDGLCLGGGLEVSMACHARISTPTTQLGLAELQLGIIPGFGGTQRLPRLVGLAKSLEMIYPSQLRAKRHTNWVLLMPWFLLIIWEILKFARAQARKKAANLEHPLICIDVIEEGIVSGPRAGLWKEGNAFQGLLFSDTCKSLLHVFFSQRATSKVPGATDLGLMPRKIMKVAILGGGIKANLQSRVRKGKMTEERYEKALSLLNGSLGYEKFKEVDLVIEAVIENVKLKQQIFADLEKYCPSHCILATNTSTIDLNLIGEKTKSQDRIVGAHFFSPAHVMPLLEIVRTQHTSAQDVVDLLDVGKRIKKTPIVVGNCTGFAVNRMFFPYTQLALLLVDYGLQILLVLVLLWLLDKRAGEGSRKGFYKYEDKRKATPDPKIMTYIQKSRSMAGVTPDAELMKLSDKDKVEMVFFPVINEACRVLDEGIAVKVSDLDIASIFGMGFPPYRGGVMLWGDSIGAKYIHEKLQQWAKRYSSFFEPCSYLAERAAKGIPLSAPAASQVKARL
ncbi:hypothetical protein ZWY2020_058390 [Hordeum vulgare]|nr:hypothetical protein ZWY2020_058390 [Hordeum vulgare]